ncbi:MAG TPA: VOC family protein [Alphaproteobacteria bacterium]|jgi:catechol 2,3-dioxygenase-like lactoylglutathione lyase family enzyme|nr:VOC family protein [Alphaproteobacteria bacterium]
MPLEAFDHYNVVTLDAQKSAQFYTDVLGLRIGDRPPFSFPGAWVYCGDTAVLHLVEKDSVPDDTGRVDHVAFRATGYAAMKARLNGAGVAYRENTVPGRGLTQIFVETPDRLTVELIFSDADVAGSQSNS